MDAASPLPTGSVRFLFTDIEGFTGLWDRHPEVMGEVTARHNVLVRQAVQANGGSVFNTAGDSFCAVFAAATDAVAAAVAAQRTLNAEAWGEVGPLRVRMAVHTGAAREREGDYLGPTLNRVNHLMRVGHGGQMLLSQATADLVRDTLPDGTSLRDLGEHRLRDLTDPERVFQLLHPELPADFPPLTAT